MTVALKMAKDINGKNITVGDEVAVRCQITALTPVIPSATKLGAGDTITVTVLSPGNTGELSGISFTISPIQCQIAQYNSQQSNTTAD